MFFSLYSYVGQKEMVARKQMKTITVVTSTAAAMFGVLLLVVAIIAFQRRRLLVRMRRLQENENDISEMSNNMDHDIYVQHFLPSYAEAVQSKPTDEPPSFDEATQNSIPGLFGILNYER